MHNQRVQRYFTPFIVAFVAIVVALVAVVLYVAFSKTTISVKLANLPSVKEFSYTAEDLEIEPTQVTIDQTYTFTDYESDTETEGTATGQVTLVNKTSGNQTLVATTRLLSDDDVLFRTTENTVVPAGGSVVVEVKADQPGEAGDIAPSKFEIVALNASLKADIYGESDSAMTGGVVKQVKLTEALIEQAKAAAKSAAEESAAEQLVDTDEALRLVTVSEQTVEGEVGDTVDSVKVTTKGTAEGWNVTADEVVTALTNEGTELAEGAVPNYTLAEDAQGKVTLEGSVALPETVKTLDFIEPATLTGKTAQQVTDLLMADPRVAEVKVNVVPFWSSRTPQLAQQIRLQLIP